MAITHSPRLGIERWSHGTDRHPPREIWDMQQGILDNLVAIDRQHATLAERPSAGVRGTYCWVEENTTLYRDDGSQWRPVVQFGGGAGAPVVAGGSGGEGSSARSARADHTHPLPLATSSAHGGMSSTDKATLDEATASNTPSALVRRDSAGRTSLDSIHIAKAPVSTVDATRKDYVDSATAAARSGAEATAASALAPVKALTDAATANATPNTFARRDSAGRFKAANPSANGDVATKGYADSEVTAAATAADFALAPVRAAVNAATSEATANTIARRDASGRLRVTTPSATTDAANRAYVDSGDASTLASAKTFATDAVAPVKALTDAATANATPSRLVQRDGDGNSQFAQAIATAPAPTAANHLTRRDWVEAHVGEHLQFKGWIGDGTNLDTVVDPGIYYQKTAPTNPSALNYPMGLSNHQGTLIVTNYYGTRGTPIQTFIAAQGSSNQALYGAPRIASRSSWNTGQTWGGWFIAAGLLTATQSVNGLMSAADKAMLDAATAAATANALARRDGAGRLKVANPSDATDVANRGFVEGLTSPLNTRIGELDDRLDATETELGRAASILPVMDRETLVKRDSAGRAQFHTPANSADAATKGYTDGLIDPLTYKSGARYVVSSGLGPQGRLTAYRVGNAVTVSFTEWDGSLVGSGTRTWRNISASLTLPVGFRPPTAVVVSGGGDQKWQIGPDGTVKAWGPGLNYGTSEGSMTFMVESNPPTSFTWGDPA